MGKKELPSKELIDYAFGWNGGVVEETDNDEYIKWKSVEYKAPKDNYKNLGKLEKNIMQFIDRANWHCSNTDYRQASVLFSSAIKICPSDAAIIIKGKDINLIAHLLEGRAYCFKELGWDGAVDDIARAIELEPKYKPFLDLQKEILEN